ncbi:hypothetical protein U1Q18_014552 [Sarracenia purpurea var. burkii]
MPLCTTTPFESEGTGCTEGTGEIHDVLALSPAALTVARTKPSKGAIYLPRSPLTRSQSMNKMDPIVMERQGT